MKKSFSLLEAVIAIGIFVLFLGAMITTFTATSKGVLISKHRLQAANLAREGTQLVTQIRDTAWIQGVGWADMGKNNNTCYFLTNPGPYQLELSGGRSGCDFQHWRLNYGSQPITQNSVPYTREINITDTQLLTDIAPPGNNAKIVRVTVSWQDYGQPYQVVVYKTLTDWKQ